MDMATPGCLECYLLTTGPQVFQTRHWYKARKENTARMYHLASGKAGSIFSVQGAVYNVHKLKYMCAVYSVE